MLLIGFSEDFLGKVQMKETVDHLEHIGLAHVNPYSARFSQIFKKSKKTVLFSEPYRGVPHMRDFNIFGNGKPH